MASNLFKTIWIPNSDGTNSTTTCTNTNTAFVHTYIGDDLTGDGTRQFPYKSVNKASQKSGISYIVFRGVVNEYFYTGMALIGDDINQIFIISQYFPYCGQIRRCTMIGVAGNSQNLYNIIYSGTTFVTGEASGTAAPVPYYYSFLNAISDVNGSGIPTFSCTINKVNISKVNKKNSIFINAVNALTTTSSIGFYYCCFPSSCIFQFNGVAVTNPIWTNNPKANVAALRNAYIAAGMSSANALSLFQQDAFGNETCQIVWEQRNGGTLPNIFNAYNADGSVADFSLNPDPLNVALYAGDTGGYVGFAKPANAELNTAKNAFSAPINVISDGSDDTVSGTLLIQNTDNSLVFATAQSQTWNRIKGNETIFIPNGRKFNGLNTLSQDGSPFGYYFGKHQNLMFGTSLQPTDTLVANTIYKVYNATGSSVTNAIIYNGNQYLPDYFFKTNSTVLSYSLLNTGSGSVVKQVLADPLQSIEVIPYDTSTTPSSSFPRFSAPLFGDCFMLFYKSGNTYSKAAGTPVLFSDTQVASMTDKIACYTSWAVTNADQEFATLAQDTINYYYAYPVLSYLRIEINGHYNFDYDQ